MPLSYEQQVAVQTLDVLYTEADQVIEAALATRTADRLHLALAAIATCHKLNALLDAAGLHAMHDRGRARTSASA